MSAFSAIKAQLLPAAIWAVLVATGLIALIGLQRERALAEKEAEAANWMPLSAKVVSVLVRPQPHARPLTPHFYRRINYAYGVDGVQYTNTRYSFAGDELFRSQAEAEASAPKPGDPLTIYFNPANPSEAIRARVAAAPVDAPRFRYGIVAVTLVEGLLLIAAVRHVRRMRRRYVPRLAPRT